MNVCHEYRVMPPLEVTCIDSDRWQISAPLLRREGGTGEDITSSSSISVYMCYIPYRFPAAAPAIPPGFPQDGSPTFATPVLGGRELLFLLLFSLFLFLFLSNFIFIEYLTECREVQSAAAQRCRPARQDSLASLL